MQTTNSTVNAINPPFSHQIISLTDLGSFTITFMAVITDYIRGLWYFTSHPLDQSLIPAVIPGDSSISSKDIPPQVHSMLHSAIPSQGLLQVSVRFSGQAQIVCKFWKLNTVRSNPHPTGMGATG